MHYHRRSTRKAKAIRTKAFFITLLFHIALIGYFTYGTEQSLAEWVPDTVKEWVGWTDGALAEEADAPRP